MTVLAHEIHNDLADFKAVMLKLKDFAVAQGWTLVSYQTNVQWASIGGGSFGFIAGTEDFLHLTSTGFGSQSLQYRLRIQNNASDSLDGIVYVYGHKGSTSYNASSATHPAAQTSPSQLWTIRPEHSFPRGGSPIPTTWLFGNSKFLLVVCKVDDDFIQTMCFGSTDLVDSAEAEGDFYPWKSTTYGTSQRWYNHNVGFSLDNTTVECIYYDGARKSTTAGANFVLTTGNGYTNSKFDAYGRCIQRNIYSEIRPIFKQKYYTIKASDSRYRLLGTGWVYRLWTEGLIEGQKIKYGANEYLCFSGGRTLEWFMGFAVRIS